MEMLYLSASKFRFLSMASFTAWPIVIDSPRRPAHKNIRANVRFMLLHSLLPVTWETPGGPSAGTAARCSSGRNRRVLQLTNARVAAWIRLGWEELECGKWKRPEPGAGDRFEAPEVPECSASQWLRPRVKQAEAVPPKSPVERPGG